MDEIKNRILESAIKGLLLEDSEGKNIILELSSNAQEVIFT